MVLQSITCRQCTCWNAACLWGLSQSLVYLFTFTCCQACTVFTVLSSSFDHNCLNWAKTKKKDTAKTIICLSSGDDQPGIGVYWTSSCLQQCSSFCWGNRKGGRRGLELHLKLPLPATGYTPNTHTQKWSDKHKFYVILSKF